jgi:hypothetical protein
MKFSVVIVVALFAAGFAESEFRDVESDLFDVTQQGAFEWAEESQLVEVTAAKAPTMYSKCSFKGKPKTAKKGFGAPPSGGVASVKVPSGWCLTLYSEAGAKGEFLKINGASNIKCLSDEMLKDGKTTWKSAAKSIKAAKCAALSTKQMKANKAKAAKASVKAATSAAYSGGTLASVAGAALASATTGADSGKVTAGVASAKTAAKAKAASTSLPAVGGGAKKAAKPFASTGIGKSIKKGTKVKPSIKLGLSIPKGMNGTALKKFEKANLPSVAWYKYAKDHKKAWKHFVMPYPKAGKVRRMPKELFPDDDDEDLKKQTLNSMNRTRITGGFNIGDHKKDGSVSSQAVLGPKGHYYLGLSRRRIGAGFGRRRRTPAPVVPGSMPNKGITSSKVTGMEAIKDKHSAKCTHIALKSKGKWPYCKKLGCFKYLDFKKANKKCMKNKACKGFTFTAHAESQDGKKVGNGCFMAPPCRFFGTVAYDYYAKSTSCVKKLKVKTLLKGLGLSNHTASNATATKSNSKMAQLRHVVHKAEKGTPSKPKKKQSVASAIFGGKPSKGKKKKYVKVVTTTSAKPSASYKWAVKSNKKKVASGKTKSRSKADAAAGKIVGKLLTRKTYDISWTVSHGSKSVTRTASSEKEAKALAKKALAAKLADMKKAFEARELAKEKKLKLKEKSQKWAAKRVSKEESSKEEEDEEDEVMPVLFDEGELLDAWNGH